LGVGVVQRGVEPGYLAARYRAAAAAGKTDAHVDDISAVRDGVIDAFDYVVVESVARVIQDLDRHDTRVVGDAGARRTHCSYSER
jgi:hypothetical protein